MIQRSERLRGSAGRAPRVRRTPGRTAGCVRAARARGRGAPGRRDTRRADMASRARSPAHSARRPTGMRRPRREPGLQLGHVAAAAPGLRRPRGRRRSGRSVGTRTRGLRTGRTGGCCRPREHPIGRLLGHPQDSTGARRRRCAATRPARPPPAPALDRVLVGGERQSRDLSRLADPRDPLCTGPPIAARAAGHRAARSAHPPTRRASSIGAIRPVTPSSTSSRNGGIGEATTGRPTAAASATTLPKLSQRDGNAHTVARRSCSLEPPRSSWPGQLDRV